MACGRLRILEVLAPILLNQLGELRQRHGGDLGDRKLGEQGGTRRTPDIAKGLPALPLTGFQKDACEGAHAKRLLGDLAGEPVAIARQHPQSEPLARRHVRRGQVTEAQAFGDGEGIVLIVFDLTKGHALLELGNEFGVEADPGWMERGQGGTLLQVEIEWQPEQTCRLQSKFEMGVAMLG